MLKKQIKVLEKIIDMVMSYPKEDLHKTYGGWFAGRDGRRIVTDGVRVIAFYEDCEELPKAKNAKRPDVDSLFDAAAHQCEKQYKLPPLPELKAMYKAAKAETKSDKVAYKMADDENAPWVNAKWLISILEFMSKTVRVYYKSWNNPLYFADWDDNGHMNFEAILYHLNPAKVDKNKTKIIEY